MTRTNPVQVVHKNTEKRKTRDSGRRQGWDSNSAPQDKQKQTQVQITDSRQGKPNPKSQKPPQSGKEPAGAGDRGKNRQKKIQSPWSAEHTKSNPVLLVCGQAKANQNPNNRFKTRQTKPKEPEVTAERKNPAGAGDRGKNGQKKIQFPWSVERTKSNPVLLVCGQAKATPNPNNSFKTRQTKYKVPETAAKRKKPAGAGDRGKNGQKRIQFPWSAEHTKSNPVLLVCRQANANPIPAPAE